MAAAPEPAPVAKEGWRVLDWVLVALAVLNLAGLAIVYKAAQNPRNPFKLTHFGQ